MYKYQPDIIAKTKIPGHNFVHTNFTLKFVPPALFNTLQLILFPMILYQGNWNTMTTVFFVASFLVPAITAISGRWIIIVRSIHAPLAFLTLAGVIYYGNVRSPSEFIILACFAIW